ncbi:hypothetical protein [Streptomyces sp. NPDC002644]
MAKVVIEIADGCDPCNEEGEATRSVDSLRMGDRVWYLCAEHKEKYLEAFIRTFGEGEVSG